MPADETGTEHPSENTYVGKEQVATAIVKSKGWGPPPNSGDGKVNILLVFLQA